MRATAILSLVIFFLAAAAADGKERVAHLTGSGSSTTQEFEVQAPWILDWRVNSDFPQSMAIEITLLDGATGFHKGLVLQTKQRGNGVRMFRESGRFRLRISATLADWDLRVEELTEEEAEAYTPAGR